MLKTVEMNAIVKERFVIVTINLLESSRKTAEMLFATIEHIKDDDAQRNYLLELQKLVTKQNEKEITKNVVPFSMKKIMQRISDKKEEPSINDIQT